MKRFSTYFIMMLGCLVSGCFDEPENTIDNDTFWVSFQNISVRFDENQKTPLQATLLLSDTPPAEDVVIPFVVFTEGGIRNGSDFYQSFSSFTIPAGRNVVVVNVLDSIRDDQVPTGDRTLTIELVDTKRYSAGLPGDDRGNSRLVVTIAEDDFTTFSETSFEEVPTLATTTSYNRPGTTEISNQAGGPPVDFVAIGDEIGFDASFASDDLDEGETGNENLGVVSNAAIAATGDPDFETTFQLGEQGYVAADLDGRLEILFDESEISESISELVIEVTFYININTTMETEDGLEIFYVVDGSRGEPILSFRGDNSRQTVLDETGSVVQGFWVTKVGKIPREKWVNGQMMATIRTGGDTELIMLDYIALKGIE